MDIALIRYQRGNTIVDLIGAVHVGERSFYQDLNRRFKQYEALLYELVAPKDLRPSERTVEGATPVSLVQNMLADGLGLAFQLDEIDYSAPNFVHADLTPEALMAAMAERNESIFTYLAQAFIIGLRSSSQKQEGGIQAIGLAMMIPDQRVRARALRRLVAPQMVGMENMAEAMESSGGTALISDRNAAAITVLKEKLAKGKRTIGIFYGGAHLPDLGRRLENELKFSRISTEWLPAWNLSAGS